MTHSKKKGMLMGALLLLAFVLWTVLILCVDVQPVGVNAAHPGGIKGVQIGLIQGAACGPHARQLPDGGLV